ncbi:MAG: WXG100 family type VII secretion target [Lachnospiraceae bacterium]|nr:WXG100 family type VII secretion target [Lachnospiraceae bacterium]
MAINKIAVNTNVLDQDIKKIDADLKSIRTELGKLNDEIKELDTMWDGQANKAFVKQYSDDYTAMIGLLDDLVRYSSTLVTAKDTYNKCEQNVDEIVRSIDI